MKSLRLGSGVVMGVALLFTILALATPAWITDSRASVGLFKAQAGGISLDGKKLMILEMQYTYDSSVS